MKMHSAIVGLAALAMGAQPALAAESAAENAAETAAESMDASDDADAEVDDLLDLSLEDLLTQQVTSAAKKSQSVVDTAAAIYTISKEDIAQSSAQSLTDLFRMVPGFQVAEVQGSGTAVSARGFSTRYASNILVMVDGAAIYGSGITGIFWDQAIFPMQDIERIEFIRGPGGSLWGSNSINGVINIITKQGIDAQGLRARLQVSKEHQRAELNIGKVLSDTLSARLYGTYQHYDSDDFVGDTVYHDHWKGGLAGLRFDYVPTEDDTIVLLTEYSEGRVEDRFVSWELDPFLPTLTVTPLDNTFRSFHTLGRWHHNFSADFDVTAQAYYNYLFRDEWGGSIERRLYDASLEGRWRASDTHEFNFGIAGRIDDEGGRSSPGTGFTASKRVDKMVSGYLQDDIWLSPDKLRLTLGSKFEHNNFTGSNAQPSARLLFKATPDHSIWASYSHAVRTPLLLSRESLIRYGLFLAIDDTDIPYYLDTYLLGNPDAKNEKLDAFEVGIRGQLAADWTYDVSAFANNYKDLTTLTPVTFDLIFVPPVPVPLGLDLRYLYTNLSDAKSRGVEVTIAGSPAPRWDVEASWSYLDISERIAPIPEDTIAVAPAGLSPHHQLRLKNDYTVSDALNLSSFVQYVGPSTDGTQDSYVKLDLRATWAATPNIEFSLIGKDLLDTRRVEYSQNILPIPNVYVRRSVALEARARF